MNLPNNLTLLRIVLVPLFIGCIVYYHQGGEYLRYIGTGIFMLACITDAADGFFARRLNQKTRLGSYIDPLADKILIVGAFLTLSFINEIPHAMRIPAWLTIAVISRDVMILFGAAVIFMTTGSLTAKPLFVGKITTLFQMLSIFVALCMAPVILQEVVYAGTLLFTILSGLGYLRRGSRLFQSQA